MKLSVKKFSKKSLSLLIALIMVFSALPLTPPISADAAVTTKTVSINGFGTVCKSQSRSADGKITIVNDQEDGNFSVGYISFTGINNLKDSSYKINNAAYTYQLYIADWTERKGITYYYPTKNNDKFVAEKNKNIMDIGDFYGTVAAHKEKAIDYFGLVSIGNTTYASERGTLSRTVNVTEMLKYALANNLDTIQLVFLLTSYGGRGDQQNTGSGDSWTDAQITVNQNDLSVNMMSNDEYVNTYIASRKTSYNVLDNSINNSGAYMSNIYSVDAWATSSDNSYYLEDNKKASDRLRFNAFNVGVALYTGQGNIRFPVVLEKVAVPNYSSDFDVYQNIEYTALNNGGSPFRLGNDNNQWQYCNSTTNLTDATSGTGAGQVVTNFSNSTSASKNSYKANGTNINYAKNDKFGTTTTKTFKNYITYTGSGNTTSYYDKLLSPTFSYRADYAVFWYNNQIGKKGWNLTNVHDKAFTLNSDFSCYVVNIKPLLEIVKSTDFTSNFSNIYKNSSKYKQSSLNNYYKVMADIVEFDLSKKRLTNDDAINSVASEIKDLVNRYNSYKSPELNQCTVTFKKSDPNNPLALPQTVKTVKVESGKTVATSDFPELTATHYYENNQHYVYNWYIKSSDVEFTSSTIVNSDIEVEERRNAVNCTYNPDDATCTAKAVCTVCREPLGEKKPHSYTRAIFVDAVGDDNSYTKYVCVNGCGQEDETVKARDYTDQSQYWNTYRAARDEANEKIANTAKYTSDSINAVKAVINGVNENDPKKSKSYIEGRTTALTTAVSKLVLRQYKITFNVVDEFGKTTETVINAQSYDYGTLLNLQLPDTYQENAVSAWKRNINGADSVVGATSHSLQVMITGTTTYTAFVKKATTASGGQAVITLNNKSNKVYDIGYVENNKVVDVTVDVDNGTITIGGKKLTAPTYSFYKVKGFKINGNTVNSGTINITGDIVIIPEYEAITTFEITGGNGVVEKSTTTSWDKRVKLTAQTPAQSGKINKWTSTINGQNVVWGYGDTLSFQATQACTVECTEVDAAEFDGFDDVSLSIDYVSYNLYRSNSITAISRVVAPEGTVEEYGTILKTANVKSGATNENYETQKVAVKNKDNYKVTNKSGVFKSTQMISNTNQFAYNFYSAQNYDKMYVGAVAYAKLTNGSYVYSDVVTYEFIR